jgi:hypothetical protein
MSELILGLSCSGIVLLAVTLAVLARVWNHQNNGSNGSSLGEETLVEVSASSPKPSEPSIKELYPGPEKTSIQIKPYEIEVDDCTPSPTLNSDSNFIADADGYVSAIVKMSKEENAVKKVHVEDIPLLRKTGVLIGVLKTSPPPIIASPAPPTKTLEVPKETVLAEKIPTPKIEPMTSAATHWSKFRVE